MNKLTKLILLLGFLIFIIHLNCYAQDKFIQVKKVLKSDIYPIQKPIVFGNANSIEKNVEEKDLLNTNIQVPLYSTYIEFLETLDDNLQMDDMEVSSGFQFLSFQIQAPKFEKLELIIKSPNMLEVYVETSKKGSKQTKENSFDEAKKLTTKLELMPNEKKTISIKVLRDKGLKNEEKINIELKGKEDSEALIVFEAKRITQIEDGMVGTRLIGISTSPAGDFIILNYQSVNKKGEKEYFSELMNLNKNDSKIRLANSSYQWMPKTNKMYSKQKNNEEGYDLILTDPKTMSQEVLAGNIPDGYFFFTPQEDCLIYSQFENIDKRNDDLKLLISPEDRQPGYLKKNNLYRYDFKTHIMQPLNFGNTPIYIEDIDNTGNFIMLSKRDENITERPFFVKSTYILDLKKNKLDTIFEKEKFIGSLQFSPNADDILVIASGEAFNKKGIDTLKVSIANDYDNQAYIYNIASKKITPLTLAFNPSIKNAIWGDMNTIYFNTVDKTGETVYEYDLKNKDFKRLNLEGDVITQLSADKKIKSFNYISRAVKSPTRAYHYDIKNKKSSLLAAPMDGIMNELNLGDVIDFTYTADDGVEIDGFYHLPPNFDINKKYPMIVYYYGGTTPTSKTFEHPYSMHYFASLGYVVYTIIPRGAIGYGTEFSANHVNDWGKLASNDIIKATENFIETHPFVEKENIGCVGASYGGFMTMYLLTQTNLFKAAIAHAGISALSSYWGEGYWGYTYSSVASADSYPWNNKDLYIKQSPLFNADKINSPLLLTHGTVDTNVPIGESIQMYTALKILGKPVEFIQIKDQNHGIADFNKKIKWTHSMGAWFDKWLKNQPEWWNTLYPKSE